MLIATILGVLLIPMLYVVVGRVIGGAKNRRRRRRRRPPATLAAEHGQGSH